MAAVAGASALVQYFLFLIFSDFYFFYFFFIFILLFSGECVYLQEESIYRYMDKKIEISCLERSDKGGTHRKYRHGGCRIGMYNFNGELEAEFLDLDSAVAENTVGATYRGIVDCITGKTKKHAGKVWRKEEVAE